MIQYFQHLRQTRRGSASTNDGDDEEDVSCLSHEKLVSSGKSHALEALLRNHPISTFVEFREFKTKAMVWVSRSQMDHRVVGPGSLPASPKPAQYSQTRGSSRSATATRGSSEFTTVDRAWEGSQESKFYETKSGGSAMGTIGNLVPANGSVAGIHQHQRTPTVSSGSSSGDQERALRDLSTAMRQSGMTVDSLFAALRRGRVRSINDGHPDETLPQYSNGRELN
ncbi:hypothetical protein BKA62DRAFT_675836 [Auriculariales sp. MPI-PUGE-AT-0066]|nr:hypothetical protein BKA62DRAFT_675836 [Auriculariales sp. MPI-PUGE-AT-0066]